MEFHKIKASFIEELPIFIFHIAKDWKLKGVWLFSLNLKMRPHKFKNPNPVNEKCRRIFFFSVTKTFFQIIFLTKSSHRGKILNVSGVFSLQEE